jgi:hypothetical protein
MDSDSDSENEDILDTLFQEHHEEMEFLDLPKENDKYYIGLCKLIRPDNYYLLLSAVSNGTFFQYHSSIIQRYLQTVSLIYVANPTIDILKLQVLPDETYVVVKKTFWISIIQRRWRRVLRERDQVMRKRGSIPAQRHFELYGHYPRGLRYLPSLYGMLRQLWFIER